MTFKNHKLESKLSSNKVYVDCSPTYNIFLHVTHTLRVYIGIPSHNSDLNAEYDYILYVTYRNITKITEVHGYV